MSNRVSRRSFLTTLGVVGLTAADAAAFGGRCRKPVYVPCPCPPKPCPPCPQPDPYPHPDSKLRVRQNIAAYGPEQLESLRRGVAAMKALPESDPRSWRFQANMHWTNGAATNELFNQCQHGTPHFLSWHRAYLHFFERILRALSGDEGLTLPYWDWYASRTLPGPFVSPGSASNPLWHDGRTMNDGTPMLPEDVAGLPAALAAAGYPGAAGFNTLLEGNPHGTVHGAVGGDMGSVPTAAKDPIFWLHHANVDRLWDVWLSQGGGRANPADGVFLNQPFKFADESGATVAIKVRDYLSSAGLGYRYDSVPGLVKTTLVATQMPAAAPPPPRVVAASGAADSALDKVEKKPLEFSTERVKVKPVTPAARTVMAAPGGPGSGKSYVKVEGISAGASPAGVRYGVYLNPPAEALESEERLKYYVGTINFFGRTRGELKMPGHGHAQVHAHAGADSGTFDETFDASAAVAFLKQSGRWDPDALEVVIMPLASTPAGAGARAAQAKAQAASKAADVSYKRITILND